MSGRARGAVGGSGWLRRGFVVALVLALLALGRGVGQGELLFVTDTTPGEIVYFSTCAACHQADGRGVPSAFPPLADHVPRLLASDDGRTYLSAVVLNGLTGAIEVEGRSYDGVMPPWPHLGDQQLADVLNYVAGAWGNDRLLPPAFLAYTAQEIAAARTTPLDAAALLEIRTQLLAE